MSKLSISVKMLLLTLSVSVALWWLIDFMQLQELRRSFLADTKRELNKDDRANHQQFNDNVRSIHTAAKLITSQKNFIDYLKRYSNGHKFVEDEPRYYHANLPPKWLPKVSILRAFFNARFAILVAKMVMF